MYAIYGKRYAIEHLVSSYKADMERKRYQEYVTDALKGLTEILTALGGHPIQVPRFTQSEKPIKEQREERTAEEVVRSIKEKLRKMT